MSGSPIYGVLQVTITVSALSRGAPLLQGNMGLNKNHAQGPKLQNLLKISILLTDYMMNYRRRITRPLRKTTQSSEKTFLPSGAFKRHAKRKAEHARGPDAARKPLITLTTELRSMPCKRYARGDGRERGSRIDGGSRTGEPPGVCAQRLQRGRPRPACGSARPRSAGETARRGAPGCRPR